MPRGVPQSEESLVKRITQLDAQRKLLKKKLQVLRIRAAAKRRKTVSALIRKNEKEVLEVIKSKAPEFLDKLLGGGPKRAKRKASRKSAVPKRRRAAGATKA